MNMLEFLAEGPGTGFLHKKWVPGGLLGASLEKAALGMAVPGIGFPIML
jgi:hypothetical protein